MENGDWRAVIQEFGVSKEDEEISQRFQTCFIQGEDKYREPLLVWIRPTLPSLTFIKEQVNRLGLSGISSVGCGCGTLEWLIQVIALRCWSLLPKTSSWEGGSCNLDLVVLNNLRAVVDHSTVIDNKMDRQAYWLNHHQTYQPFLLPLEMLIFTSVDILQNQQIHRITISTFFSQKINPIDW